MVELDVFKLAEQVSEDSKSGSLSRELSLDKNVLYASSEKKGKFTRLLPSGEFSVGVFQDGRFVTEEILAIPCK